MSSILHFANLAVKDALYAVKQDRVSSVKLDTNYSKDFAIKKSFTIVNTVSDK